MMGPEASGSGFFTQPTYRRLPPCVIFHAGGDQTVIRAVSEDRPHRPKVDHLAGLGLRGGGRSVNHRLPAETKLGHAQWAKACLEQGSTTRLSTASARYVPGDSAKPGGRAPALASMTAATPRSVNSPHTAATAPKSRCRVRSGSMVCSRASSNASISAAVPTYRSEIIFGLPSTQPISRRYQYGFPLITFLYRLATDLGHRPRRGSSQAPNPVCPNGKRVRPAVDDPPRTHDHRKLGLAPPACAWLPGGGVRSDRPVLDDSLMSKGGHRRRGGHVWWPSTTSASSHQTLLKSFARRCPRRVTIVVVVLTLAIERLADLARARRAPGRRQPSARTPTDGAGAPRVG